MKRFIIIQASLFILFSIEMYCQKESEITQLEEKHTYEYKSYYENGNIKSLVGFYSKNPFASVEEFELKLKDYKIKYHGEQKEFYSNGQLKEIVVYDKGKVIQYAKHYFEDGEIYDVNPDKLPSFQFTYEEQNKWFHKRIQEIETKYGVNLEGNGIIALEISKSGEIKTLKVRAQNENQNEYLGEIADQIKVIEPALKNGEPIGTRFAFKVEM